LRETLEGNHDPGAFRNCMGWLNPVGYLFGGKTGNPVVHGRYLHSHLFVAAIWPQASVDYGPPKGLELNIELNTLNKRLRT